jgi:hypothetical protein
MTTKHLSRRVKLREEKKTCFVGSYLLFFLSMDEYVCELQQGGGMCVCVCVCPRREGGAVAEKKKKSASMLVFFQINPRCMMLSPADTWSTYW